MSEHPSFIGMPDGEPVAGKTYRADGWEYFNVPGVMSIPDRDMFLSVIGRDDYVILIQSHTNDSATGKWWRGHLLISPWGQANLLAWRNKGRQN